MIKKNQGYTSRTLAHPSPPLHPITSHFYLTPPTPQSERCESPLKSNGKFAYKLYYSKNLSYIEINQMI